MGIVIVTGASGFVGKNVVNYLNKNDIKVCAIWHNHELKELQEGVIPVHVDLNNMNEIKNQLSYDKLGTVDAVIHLAAQLPGLHSIEDYLDNTINTTRNMVLYAQENSINNFIYASTIGIYGDTTGIVNEDTDRTNLSDYSMAKYIGERIVEEAYLPRRVIIRLPRMVGRGMPLDCPWIPSLVSKLMRGDEIKYYNPDNYFNQVAHVDNLSEFLVTLLKNTDEQCLKIGIGASEPIKIIEVIELLKNLLGSSSVMTKVEVKKSDSVNLLDISKAISAGLYPLTVRETLEKLAKDLKG